MMQLYRVLVNLIPPVLVDLIPPSVRLHRSARRAWQHGEGELRLLPVLCRSKAKAIDVGANRGTYSYFIHKYSSHLIAIEANPRYANFLTLALPDASVIEAAASDHHRKAILRIPLATADDGMATIEPSNRLERMACQSITVSSLTLDSLNLLDIGFIKIDVEGHELAVLKGAISIIQRDHPNILIELEERHRPNAVGDTKTFLYDNGYLGFFYVDGHVFRIESFDPKIHQDLQRIQNAHSPYVNNFIFVHRAREETIADLLAYQGGLTA